MGYSLGWTKPLILTFDPNFQRDIQQFAPEIRNTETFFFDVSAFQPRLVQIELPWLGFRGLFAKSREEEFRAGVPGQRMMLETTL